MEIPAFLFMDESEFKPLNIAALTGIVVPLDKYKIIREEMAKLIIDIISPQDTIPLPIELHASNLLPHLPKDDNSDMIRLSVFRRAVEIVNEHQVLIFRVCYTNHSEILKYMKDIKLYALNFFGMQAMLQPIFADRILIPVMDGIPNIDGNRRAPNIDRNMVNSFIRQNHLDHHYMQFNFFRKNVSIKNLDNISEILFSSSQYSNLIQLADIISYLLLKKDQSELMDSPNPSLYKTAILSAANAIDKDLLKLHRGDLKFS